MLRQLRYAWQSGSLLQLVFLQAPLENPASRQSAQNRSTEPERHARSQSAVHVPWQAQVETSVPQAFEPVGWAAWQQLPHASWVASALQSPPPVPPQLPQPSDSTLETQRLSHSVSQQ